MAYDSNLADRVRSVLTGQDGLSERKMFGGITFLINGHMCCGVTGNDLVLRLGAGKGHWRTRSTAHASHGFHGQGDEVNDLRGFQRHGIR